MSDAYFQLLMNFPFEYFSASDEYPRFTVSVAYSSEAFKPTGFADFKIPNIFFVAGS